MTMSSGTIGGLIIALLTVAGTCSWIGVLITKFFERKNAAANTEKTDAERRKVNAEASEIFNNMAVRTVEANEKLYAKIDEDNDRLRRELRESNAELITTRNELAAARTELTAVRRLLEKAIGLLEQHGLRLDGLEGRMDSGGI